MVYDVTNVTKATNIIQNFAAANVLSGDYFVNALLGGLWVIFFVTFKYYNTNDGLLASTAMTWVISLLFWSNPGDRIVGTGTVMFWFAALVGISLLTYLREQ